MGNAIIKDACGVGDLCLLRIFAAQVRLDDLMEYIGTRLPIIVTDHTGCFRIHLLSGDDHRNFYGGIIRITITSRKRISEIGAAERQSFSGGFHGVAGDDIDKNRVIVYEFCESFALFSKGDKMAVRLFGPFADHVSGLFVYFEAQAAVDGSLQLVDRFFTFGACNNKVIRMWAGDGGSCGGGQGK